jgi:hypothetical protein
MERRGITQEGAYVPHLAYHDQEAGSRGVEPPFLEAFGWLPMPVAKTFSLLGKLSWMQLSRRATFELDAHGTLEPRLIPRASLASA